MKDLRVEMPEEYLSHSIERTTYIMQKAIFKQNNIMIALTQELIKEQRKTNELLMEQTKDLGQSK